MVLVRGDGVAQDEEAWSGESVQQRPTYKTTRRFPEFEVPYKAWLLEQVNKPISEQDI